MPHTEVIDLSDILDGYENKWVVISWDNTRVIAVADSLEGLGTKVNDGRVMLVPDPEYAYGRLLNMRKKYYAVLSVVFKREEDGTRWLAECVETGTAAFGDTLEGAQEAIREALELHLNALERAGERGRFFEEHRIHLQERVERESVEVSAPLARGAFTQPYVHQLAEA